ncbi:MAG: hypothetical protein Q9208_006624 [Pyrenodesmia sp. 3 TL-2023]
MAGTESEQQWPPRSPFEALLSSPSGRSRIRRYQDRTSPSPSPLKKAKHSTPKLHQRTRVSAPPSEDEEDEDEETLQLRLHALEAKLKLKRLQQKRSKKTPISSDVENERPAKSSACSEPTSRSAAEGKEWPITTHRIPKAQSTQPVQVPASPQRKLDANETPRSPGRVLLGIDKGLKGRNVSLRRVPEPKPSQTLDDPFLGHALQAKSSSRRNYERATSAGENGSRARPLTFSEKIAETRQRDKEQQEKTRRLQVQRSAGFGIGQEALEVLKDTAELEARTRPKSGERMSCIPAFSRDEVLKAASKPNGRLLDRGISSTADQPAKRQKEFKNPNASPEMTLPVKKPPKARSPTPQPAKPDSKPHKETDSKDSTDLSLFEPFSSVHLTKRLIPHESLTKALSGKSILLLPNVLGAVKAPDYSFPEDLEADIVILATIASKSTPLAHKDHHKTAEKARTDNHKTSLEEAAESEHNARGKYMAVTLTDLKWTLDLYLFSSAFTRFRKLTPGTVIAILNPNIMPPPPHNPHNNRFSLTLNSNEDTILEIGTSRDLGWCSSFKRDGQPCDAWIDKRHTSVCEFHVDRVIEKTRRGRMDINGINTGFAPGGKKNSRSGFWGGGGTGSGDGKKYINSRAYDTGHFARKEQAQIKRELPQGQQYDRVNKTTYFVGGKTGFGQSAASLLDADGLAGRGGREERVRKRLAEREREKDIAKQLGQMGKGMGGEYLKIRHEAPAEVSASQAASQQTQEPVDAASLGLKKNKAGDVQLSPIKKRKLGSSLVDEGARKITRFVTDGGIKEAGRESLGVGVVASEQHKVGGDDDDLDIV